MGKRTAMESIIIIDQNLLGVCLGPGLRPWRGDDKIIVILMHSHGSIDLAQATMQKAFRKCYRMATSP
jgi:hypothetical protein